jgi:NitT/TauT family transport system substrate-binding protein
MSLGRAAALPAVLLSIALLVSCQSAAAPTTSPPPPATSAATGGSPSSATPGAPAGAAAQAAVSPAPAASTAESSGPPQVVRLGTVGSFTDAGFAVGIGQGYFQRQNLEIDVQRLDSAALMIPFVSTGQLDVAGGGPSAGLFQALARGVDLRIVADKGTAGEKESFFCFLVRKDLVDSGRVRTEAYLRGLTIAAAAPGNSVELATHRMLEKGGLTEQDVTFVNMAYQDMLGALATSRIDVASTLEPVCAQAVAQGSAVRWRTTADYQPLQTVAAVYYSPQFAQNTDAATRFMVAYLQGVRDYRRAYLEKDAALRQKLDPIMAEWTGIDPSVYDGMVIPELLPDGRINVASIDDLQDFFLQSGQIRERVDIQRYVDDSFREAAVRRIDGR